MSEPASDNNTSVYFPPVPEDWEIGTITIRSKSEEELQAVVEHYKRKYGPSIFTVSHIPQRNREYYHKIIMFNAPIVDTEPNQEQK
jgi:hypothetical protein